MGTRALAAGDEYCMSDLGGFTVDTGGFKKDDDEEEGVDVDESSNLGVKAGTGLLLLINDVDCDDEAR